MFLHCKTLGDCKSEFLAVPHIVDVSIERLDVVSGTEIPTFTVTIRDFFNQVVSAGAPILITLEPVSSNVSTTGTRSQLTTGGIASFSTLGLIGQPSAQDGLRVLASDLSTLLPVQFIACPPGTYEDTGARICRACTGTTFTNEPGMGACLVRA